MQHSTPLILKRADFTETGMFEAYASTYDRDAYDDIILPGAFKVALAAHQKSNTMPALLWQHDHKQPLGKWISFKEDKKGLIGIGKFTLSTQKGREAFELLKDDALSFSIGFIIAPKGTEDKNGIRYIKSISRLSEVSVVSIPANTSARLVALKKSSSQQIRNFERMLIKSAGFDKRQATSAASGYWDVSPKEEALIIQYLEVITNRVEAIL